MGTSQSSKGPRGDSPLIPPWADDEPHAPVPAPENRRFAPFREAVGRSVSGGDRQDLRKALGSYARKATAGGRTAARRMGSVTQTGGALFALLNGSSEESDLPEIDLQSLSGLSCEAAISYIAEALKPKNGDSDKISAALNSALSNALEGITSFDPSQITDDIITNTMINYLAESIFLQMVMDAGDAWNKAESHADAVRAEGELRELVKVVVDKHMAPKMDQNLEALTKQEIVQIERQTIIDSWNEWESYQ